MRVPHTTEAPTLRMIVPATAANVTLLRQAATGVAEAVGFPTQSVEDVRLAVTEACTNVVMHAYEPEREDTCIVFEALVGPGGELLLSVRDDGRGPSESSEAPGLGLGLALIAALASDHELRRNPAGRGAEMWMAFSPRLEA